MSVNYRKLPHGWTSLGLRNHASVKVRCVRSVNEIELRFNDVWYMPVPRMHVLAADKRDTR
jgi:hypothetical protein